LSEGLCLARFDAGILVPFYSGKAPVEERIVGLVFVGDGHLEVDFEARADALRFANHRVLNMGEPKVDWQAMTRPIGSNQSTVPLLRITCRKAKGNWSANASVTRKMGQNPE
jgi:hypothetical protein